VKDILAEIGPRVRQLERQARRAQDYSGLSAELHAMQRSWFSYHWGRLQVALREAKHHHKTQETLAAQHRAELAASGKRLEDSRRQQIEVRAQLGGWQREENELRAQAESLQRQLAVLSERARLLRQQADDAQADIAPLEIQLASQRERVARAQNDLAEIARRIQNRAQEITAAQQALEERQALRQSIVQSIEAARAELRRVESDIADRRSRRKQLDERRAALESDILQQRQSIAASNIELGDQQTRLASVEAELAQHEERIVARRRQSGELAAQIETIRARQAELDGESSQALRAEAELRARYDAIRAARATLAGFDSGARSILSARLPGVRGAIARMIDVERGWERAIEAALGTDLQAILVDAWSEAESARDHLGSHQAGERATIVPLDSLRPQNFPLPGGVRRAIQLVVCDDAIRPAVDALLGNVVAVETLPQARALLPSMPPGVHIVTQSGDVLRSSGAIVLGRGSGSSNGLTARAASLIEHERDWRELPEAIKLAGEQAAGIESKRAAESVRAEEVSRRQAEVAAETSRLSESASEKAAERAEIVRRIEANEREIAWHNDRIQQAETELRSLAERDAALAGEIEIMMQAHAAQQQVTAELDQKLAGQPMEEQAAQLTALQTAVAVSEQLRQGHESVLQSHRAALEQTQAQIEVRGQRIAALAGEQAQIEAQLASFHAQEATLTEQMSDVRARIDPAEADLSRMEVEYAEAETRDRAARDRLQELESRHNRALMEATRKEDELKHLRARIDEELGLVQLELADLTAPLPLPLAPLVTELPTVTELPEGLETEMQRLKARIRRLGPINPEAETEYDAERERYEFLNAQSADLSQAIEQLHAVIAELDQLMEKSFSETFSAIAEEFKITFTQLFGGGSARLVMTEPDNITQTGVDIIARPPGKKQQGLALLSGGERSLTAAALLFAILRVKPPPFCILDETDAALDEANVGRFRDMIDQQSAHTQFVLITHNRGTIEAADTIYGVTMERDSSSRVYSLKLEGDKAAA
jgi:chromosome segregation protein